MKIPYLLKNGYIILVPDEINYLNHKYIEEIYKEWDFSNKNITFSKFIRMWMYNTTEDFELIEPKI